MPKFGRDPFKDFLDIQDEVNRLFRRGFMGECRTRLAPGDNAWAPAVDVYETKRNLVLLVELPGLTAQDIDIAFDDGVLRISGVRRVPDEMKEENVHCIERDYGRFERRISLPHRVDESSIKANFMSGLLKVELPKVGEDAPKHIPIIRDESEKTGA